MSETRNEASMTGEGVHDPKPFTTIQPVQLSLDDKFQFRCHKGIACFNKCCENIDIMLAPYDLLRLKRRFGLTSREFIDQYTRDYQMDSHGMPGLKLRTKPDSSACIFLTPEGCSVYPDRPTACRYYALGLLHMHKAGSSSDEDSYFVVKEDHCLGHQEPQVQTVREYRKEQGLELYDEENREWRRIVLKKRSAGPAIGKPSPRSFELFFLASYDIEGFRNFAASPGFGELFEIDPELKQELMTDDVKLMHFAFRFLKQVLFGEATIPVKQEAAEKRREHYQQKLEAIEREAAERRTQEQDRLYDSLKEDS
ncbi:MAG: YkgJ family cysteine cluster protein [Betaproteobacteria bacterium]|nr:YkgJ family cysteine cluster protein [Betaproteobacteria bacterium]